MCLVPGLMAWVWFPYVVLCSPQIGKCIKNFKVNNKKTNQKILGGRFEKTLGKQDTPVIIIHKKVFDIINHSRNTIKKTNNIKSLKNKFWQRCWATAILTHSQECGVSWPPFRRIWQFLKMLNAYLGCPPSSFLHLYPYDMIADVHTKMSMADLYKTGKY